MNRRSGHRLAVGVVLAGIAVSAAASLPGSQGAVPGFAGFLATAGAVTAVTWRYTEPPANGEFPPAKDGRGEDE